MSQRIHCFVDSSATHFVPIKWHCIWTWQSFIAKEINSWGGLGCRCATLSPPRLVLVLHDISVWLNYWWGRREGGGGRGESWRGHRGRSRGSHSCLLTLERSLARGITLWRIGWWGGGGDVSPLTRREKWRMGGEGMGLLLLLLRLLLRWRPIRRR